MINSFEKPMRCPGSHTETNSFEGTKILAIKSCTILFIFLSVNTTNKLKPQIWYLAHNLLTPLPLDSNTRAIKSYTYKTRAEIKDDKHASIFSQREERLLGQLLGLMNNPSRQVP